jgi:hypothetical protein
MAFQTAGFSGTPRVKKLGIKEGHRVLFPGAPEGFDALLDMPGAVEIADEDDGSTLDVIVLFVRSQDEMEARFGPLAARLAPAGGLWIAWPKKTSGIRSDLTDNVVREYGLSTGLVDVKVCAIDETWSGLKFVIRVKDRTKNI